MKVFFLSRVVYYFYFFMQLTWRKKIVESDQFKSDFNNKHPMILAHWHGDELALTFLVKRYKSSTMTSTSKDGQIIDYVIHKLGGKTSKGSSTREAIQALKGLIRLVKSGHPASLAVDGPRGPIYKAKPGVFQIAKATGARIYPVGVEASSKHTFVKAWNKIFLPLPFSKISICYGEPLVVGRDGLSPKDPMLAEKLEKSIMQAKEQALHRIANK